MTVLTWTDDLALQQPQMDATHREFIDLLAQAAQARQSKETGPLLQRFEHLVEHTVEHFAQEDRWMAATGFAPENCHSFQHTAVLNVMSECLKRARDDGDFEPLGVAVDELAIWFPQHAKMMDAGLALHMAELGYDPVSGACARPMVREDEPAALISGCGSASCA
ncbi:hemerythrin-like metal-binding domain-containing protein [Burkholderiales bacterium JOSHI_001]|nr:hemerythrin-like metal-binding domain-containing protein [Burkholderiales bacterium JOSHI_001]